VELANEHGKALHLEEEAEKAQVECDCLWRELQAEAKVSVEVQAARAERRRELDAALAELQRLIASIEEASIALLLPLLPLDGGLTLVKRVCSLAVHVPQVIRGAVHKGASAALTLMKRWLPEVKLGPMASSVPKETSDKQMEEAKDMVASLVAVVTSIIDDRLLLMDEYLEEDDVPVKLRCLRDLRRNLVVKLVAAIQRVYPPLNNHDIEGVPTHPIFVFSFPFMLHALLISVGSIPSDYFSF
jgi:hypothetical protein